MVNVIKLYKIERWLYIHGLELFAKIIQAYIFIIYNCHISYKCIIDEGSMFLHKGMSTLIIANTVIGKNCKIGMNVLITGKAPYKNVPKLGNNIYIGPGSIISGPVIIEDNVIIAPNSYLINSVSANMIVGGSPAKIIGDVTKLSYDIMDNIDTDNNSAPYLVIK